MRGVYQTIKVICFPYPGEVSPQILWNPPLALEKNRSFSPVVGSYLIQLWSDKRLKSYLGYRFFFSEIDHSAKKYDKKNSQIELVESVGGVSAVKTHKDGQLSQLSRQVKDQWNKKSDIVIMWNVISRVKSWKLNHQNTLVKITVVKIYTYYYVHVHVQ